MLKNDNGPAQSPARKVLFDPEKAFLELSIVRATIIIIILLSLLSAIAIYSKGQYPFDFSSTGFNNATTYFKVPIGILTLSIPVLALLAANHRSEQTKKQMTLTRTQIARTDKQIELTSGQNNFSNFYKHIEVFVKFCEDHFSSQKIEIDNPRKIHNYIFPDAAKGNIKVNEYVVLEFSRAGIDFFKAAEGLKNSDMKEKSIFDLFQIDSKLCTLFGIKRTGSISGSSFNYIQHFNNHNYIIPGDSYNGLFRYLLEPFKVIDELLRFDTAYLTPSPVVIVMQLTFGPWMSDSVMNGSPFDIKACYPSGGGVIEVTKEGDTSKVTE